MLRSASTLALTMLAATIALLTAACMLDGWGGNGSSSSDDSSNSLSALIGSLEGPSGVLGSCADDVNNICVDFTGTAWTTALVQQACIDAAETYQATTCSLTGSVGSCTENSAPTDANYAYQTITRYYGTGTGNEFIWTNASAEAACIADNGLEGTTSFSTP